MNTSSWELPPENISIGNGHVHVWRMWLELADYMTDEMQSKLSTEEKHRAGRFRGREDRIRFIAAHHFTREILSNYLDKRPEKINIAYNQYGKPELEEYDDASGLRFNLSHSDDIAVLAVGRWFNVGVDIERVKHNAAIEDIARRFFSSGEVELFLSQPENIRDEAFFRCWTRKEAYIKARGKGMSIPLDQFEVSFLPGEPPKMISIMGDSEAAARWSLFHLVPGDGYIGALAVEGHPDQLTLFQWGEEWGQNP